MREYRKGADFSALLMFVCAALIEKDPRLGAVFLENNIFAEGYLTAFIPLPRTLALFQRMWAQEWQEMLLR